MVVKHTTFPLYAIISAVMNERKGNDPKKEYLSTPVGSWFEIIEAFTLILINQEVNIPKPV